MKNLNTLLIACLATFSMAVQADAILIRGASVHTMTGDGLIEKHRYFHIRRQNSAHR